MSITPLAPGTSPSPPTSGGRGGSADGGSAVGFADLVATLLDADPGAASGSTAPPDSVGPDVGQDADADVGPDVGPAAEEQPVAPVDATVLAPGAALLALLVVAPTTPVPPVARPAVPDAPTTAVVTVPAGLPGAAAATGATTAPGPVPEPGAVAPAPAVATAPIGAAAALPSTPPQASDAGGAGAGDASSSGEPETESAAPAAPSGPPAGQGATPSGPPSAPAAGPGPVAPTAPVVAPPAAHSPHVQAASRHVVEEVARMVEAAGGGSRVTRQVVLRLDPGSLGEVQVRLRVHAGVVRVHLSAGDTAVRDSLTGDLARLHDLLGTRADDVRVVVQDLPRGPRDATGAQTPSAEPAPGSAGSTTPGSSDGRRSGQQPGDAPPEHGRPTWMSDVNHATDGAQTGVRGPTPADPRATGPDRLDVSV